VTQGSIMVAKSRIASAAKLTESSPVTLIPGIYAWFESTTDASFNNAAMSDGDRVPVWYDISTRLPKNNTSTQSGTQFHPTYREGAINNLPAIRFDGNQTYYALDDLSSLYPAEMTLFFVIKPTFAPAAPDLRIIYSFHQGTTNAFLVGFNTATNALAMNGTNYNANYQSNLYNKGSIYTFRTTTATGVGDVLINGAAIATGASWTLGSLTANRFSIGQEWDSGPDVTDVFIGDIGEIIIFSRSLNNTDRREVENYLSKKWGIKTS
jgi:hypothetical protein